MFLSFINKVLALVLVPIMTLSFSPVMLIKKLVWKPEELISLSEVVKADDPVYLTAHRGVTAVAPENTIPAYEKAVELGYYTAECDIRLTKDNVWVLSHGDDLNKRFWQFGNVSDYTYEELLTYKYKNGSNFWAYEDLKIPTLDEFLDVFVGTKTRPQIEIKGDNYDQLSVVVDKVKEKGLEDSAIIISFDLGQLKAINSIDKNIELWYLVDEITEENIAEAKALGDNVWLSANFDENTQQSIQLAIDNDIDVSYWTVNTLEDAQMLYDMGVRYIETDILCY